MKFERNAQIIKKFIFCTVYEVEFDSKVTQVEDGFGGDILGGLAGPDTKLLPGLPKPKFALEGERLPLDPQLLILLGALGALGLGAPRGAAFCSAPNVRNPEYKW